jgi:predicted secreted hydrolase
MDHEFGSGAMGDNQVGWDWFSLQFDSGAELMVYLLRKSDGSSDPASSGTWISPDGKSEYLHLDDISIQTQNYWVSPYTNARYPAEWTLAVPSVQLRVHVKPLLPDQELRTSKSTRVTYWEGAVETKGHHSGDPIQGQGYVELTGYAQPLTMDGE